MRGALLLPLLIAASAHAAPLEPAVGVVAPKGRPGADVAHHATSFLYAGYRQMPSTPVAGAVATMLQAAPALAEGDAHTLAELAVQSADGRQIVEIGWTVDVRVNNDSHPRLFVFHWVDGMPTCYNACGFVQVSTTRKPGMRVTPGATAEYAIENRNGDWWLSYEGDDLGYFPGSLWNNTYTRGGLVQWFGEVAAGTDSPCSEMGSGERADSATSARMTGLALIDPGGTRVPADAIPGEVTNEALYTLGQTSPTSFAFGGPGAAFGCCRPSTCTRESATCGAVPDPSCGGTLACGGCEAGDRCGDDFQCAAAPPPEYIEPPEDTGGCCDAGTTSSSTIGLSLGVLALVLRRRRRAG